jgi:amino acid permease
MSTLPEHHNLSEKEHAGTAPAYAAPAGGVHKEGHFDSDPENAVVESEGNMLHKDLKGRHMQMIAM